MQTEIPLPRWIHIYSSNTWILHIAFYIRGNYEHLTIIFVFPDSYSNWSFSSSLWAYIECNVKRVTGIPSARWWSSIRICKYVINYNNFVKNILYVQASTSAELINIQKNGIDLHVKHVSATEIRKHKIHNTPTFLCLLIEHLF